jgi:Mg2+-importing ATPase
MREQILPGPSLSRGDGDDTHRRAGASGWLSWMLGAAILIALVVAAVHLSEEREFVGVAERAKPWWLVLAVCLQGATYLAQGEIFRRVPRAAGYRVPRTTTYELSLAKLFIDQALPSAGIGSTIVVAKALERRAVPRAVVAASMVINIASYHAAYVVCLGAALAITTARGETRVPVLVMSVLFVAFSIALTTGLLLLSGRDVDRVATALRRFPVLRNVLVFLKDADPHLTRHAPLLGSAVVWQTAIFVLDAGSMWVLIQSLGTTASPEAVFASFMISSVVRTVGIVPGGLGIFEATSVWTLNMMGVAVPVGLAATLLFRGLSFWLPMLPGWWISRRLTAGTVAAAKPAGTPKDYWSSDADALVPQLGSTRDGLSAVEAAARLREYGPNQVREQRRLTRTWVFLNQLRNPLLLVLIFAAAASALSGEWVDAAIVVVIVLATVTIGFTREYQAETAAAALQARVRTRARVRRDGRTIDVPMEDVVPGDVVLLSAGSLVPADGVILEAADFFVSEAVLTGESFPVEKRPGAVAPAAGLRDRSNCVFLGTNARSGTARCLIAATGVRTQFGDIAHRLTLRPPETEFDRGLRRFGHLLTSAMLIMVFLVFIVHVVNGRPPIETLLFSVALAVGLSPELLPAILSVNLARGAQMMARHGVLVRHLTAIENLGSMDVLCTDKTGTLTEGLVVLEGAYDAAGSPSAEVQKQGAWNAALETGLASPLDDAILAAAAPDLSTVRKLAEIPFDFVRKRVSVVVETEGRTLLITKGAFHHVLDICTRSADGVALDAAGKARLEERYDAWGAKGIRVLAVALRTLESQPAYSRELERDLTFTGFLTFFDRPKADVADAIRNLATLGVSIKIITGDSKLVTQHVASLVGLRADRLLTGTDIQRLSDEALWRVAESTDLFVEVDPNQKERIILAVKKMGHVVGFLGDGVNDAPAMHAADTSLSVEQAVDVARAAADFVLLERSLDVIRRGIEEGRKTFANTLKYVLTTMSANLGNMISMAAASLFLPFLPLLAGQILLNNLLSDVPAIGIADDAVDPELIARPQRWNMRFIGRFMLEFGAVSSVFDFLTFGALLLVFHAAPDLFRTGWFVESLLTELVIALVVRTRRPFFRSRPGRVLLWSTIALVALTVAIPYLPFIGVFGFVPLPGTLLLTVTAITALYVVATEITKRRFYRVVL